MAEGALITAGAGTLLQMKGNDMQMRSEIASSRSQAMEMRRQAIEVQERFKMNKNFMKREGKGFAQQQAALFASSGIQAGGLTLLQMEESYRMTQEAINVEKFETEKQIEALLTGEKMAEKAAADARRVGRMRQLGTAIGGAGQLIGASL